MSTCSGSINFVVDVSGYSRCRVITDNIQVYHIALWWENQWEIVMHISQMILITPAAQYASAINESPHIRSRFIIIYKVIYYIYMFFLYIWVCVNIYIHIDIKLGAVRYLGPITEYYIRAIFCVGIELNFWKIAVFVSISHGREKFNLWIILVHLDKQQILSSDVLFKIELKWFMW